MRDPVDLVIEEVALFIEVAGSEGAAPHRAVRYPPPGLHHESEHLVVGLTREHDASSAQLVKGHRCRPEVNVEVVGQTEN